MATSNEVDAALRKLRSARAKLFEVSALRTSAVTRRTRVNLTVSELNQQVADARAAVAAARTEVVAVLGQPETEPDPSDPVLMTRG